MKLLVLITLLVSFAWAEKKVVTDADKFGAELSLTESISVDAAIKMMTEKQDKPVLVKAKVDKVCEKSGPSSPKVLP